jgi:hypothetical protein
VSNDPELDLTYPSIPWLLSRDGGDPEAAASRFAEETIREARWR